MACAKPNSKNLFHRIQDLLSREPDLYDVVFSVGPEKKKVKAVSLLLKAASSVFEKKFQSWNNASVPMEQDNGIPIPDFDANAFEVFVKLTMLDSWTANALKDLGLQKEQILDLISICREYKIESGLKHLEVLMKPFYNEFAAFKNSEKFLSLSYSHLHTVLASDNLPLKELDVFECACRWAKAQCGQREIEENAEHLRLVLGDVLYEIRFPLMTPQEFTRCKNTHNLLTADETVDVYTVITISESQRAWLDFSYFKFKTKARAQTVHSTVEVEREEETDPAPLIPGAEDTATEVMTEVEPTFSKLCLTMDSKIVDSPPFVCDGKENWNTIVTKQKIEVLGVGFLGPIDEDAEYNVTVGIEKYIKLFHKDESFAPLKMEKQISAKKGTVFRIMFDQPVTLTKEGSLKTSTNYYRVYYSLKGPNTKSFQRNFKLWDPCTSFNGKDEFELRWFSNQLAEILYKNV